jgi:hypothetical protein
MNPKKVLDVPHKMSAVGTVAEYLLARPECGGHGWSRDEFLECLVKFMRSHVARDPQSVSLVDEGDNPGTIPMSCTETDCLTCEARHYIMFTQEDSPDEMDWRMRPSIGLDVAVILSSLKGVTLSIEEGVRKVDEQGLTKIVENATYYVASAWDEDGFVYWEL